MSIPIVDISYLHACIRKRKLLPTYLYAPQAPENTSDITQNQEEQVPFCMYCKNNFVGKILIVILLFN